MRTEELVEHLATDVRRLQPPMWKAVTRWLVLAAVCAIVGFGLVLGVRPDLMEALSSWRFCLKLAVTMIASIVALISLVRLADPLETRVFPRSGQLLLGLIAVAVIAELISSPMETWSRSLVGNNSLVCLVAIPVLSMPFLAGSLLATRAGAPRSPAGAGAAAGLLAASLAGVLYALHCVDDSPLFVAVWYGLASVPVVAIGAVVGSRILRW